MGIHARSARLAADAVATAGLDNATVTLTRRAGHVHDLGRIGVSNQIWSKPAALTAAEFERVRLHPYLTVRILSQVSGLEQVAALAGNHHECLNGAGYPRSLTGDRAGPARPDSGRRCLLPVRIGAQAVPGADCRRRMRRAGCRRGSAPANSILPQSMPFCTRPAMVIVTPYPRPDRLTPREIEVLRLVATGASNKEIAAALVISEKTARNHVERTYAKIGVSNRIGASMYALEHGLAGAPAPREK